MGIITRGYANKVTADGVSSLDSTVITGATAETTIDGADSVLIYDDSASALRKMTRANFIGGGNTPAFLANVSSNQSVSDTVSTKIQFNTEVFDTNSDYDNSVNYRFTPTVAGKYFVSVNLRADVNAVSIEYVILTIKKNGSNYFETINNIGDNTSQAENIHAGIIMEMNGSSDYVEAFGTIAHGTGSAVFSAGDKATYFQSFKIIE